MLLFRSWQENPSVTTVTSVTYPVTDLTFPAVTLCTDTQYNVFGMTRMLLNRLRIELEHTWAHGGTG